MFAVIYIPNFRLQSALRHEPELATRPVALVDAQNKEGVLEASAAARLHGINAGMSSTQAMARCPGVVLRFQSSAREEAAADALVECAYSFSPRIEATAPGVCTLDLRGLPVMAALGRPEGDADVLWWAEKVIRALRLFQLQAQLGIAATPALALHAAKAAQPGREGVPLLRVRHATEFISALPLNFLEPPPEMQQVLERWGIRTVGAFLALGKDKLAERLGPEAVDLFEAAATDAPRPLELTVPRESFEESADFDLEIESLQPLLFVLRRFIEQLVRRLELVGQVPQALDLRLKLSSGDCYERPFTIPAPTGDVEALFRMLHTHLENVRTTAPIVSVTLSARPCRARQHQFGLFEVSLRDPNQFEETLARLSALCGPGRVDTPVSEESHRPDSFQMKPPAFDRLPGGTPAPGQACDGAFLSGGAPALPLRRFRPAIHADVDVERGCPAFINSLKLTSPVLAARGPWRSSGHWWEADRLWRREEWDVTTRDGLVYRIFESGGDWFIEGVYD